VRSGRFCWTHADKKSPSRKTARPVGFPPLRECFRRLVNDALHGGAGAMKLLLSLVDRYGDSPEAKIKLADLLAEDREILARYLQQPAGGEPTPSERSAPLATQSDDRGGDDDGV
jgi:hypothetical protein